MGAQEDYETLQDILSRTQFTDPEKESFLEETMASLGYKVKKLFMDDESKSPAGPRRIGGSGSGRRVANGSQYAD